MGLSFGYSLSIDAPHRYFVELLKEIPLQLTILFLRKNLFDKSRENFLKMFFFQVKVMLRVASPPSGSSTDHSPNSFFSLDKRKKQVTLVDPTSCSGSSAPEDRRVGVAAPKMFAFDAIFSQDDSQVNYSIFI